MIETSCPGCGKRLRVRDEAAGKRGKCPHCGAVVNVSRSDEAGSMAAMEALAAKERLIAPQPQISHTSMETTAARLTPCPDCGRQVSLAAATCPNCGRPLAPTRGDSSLRADLAKEKQERVAKSESRKQIALLLLAIALCIASIGVLANGPYVPGTTQAQVAWTICLAAMGAVLLFLGGLPGSIARGRGHPNTSAIQLCGWIGLLTLGVFWLVALIWAYTKPKDSSR